MTDVGSRIITALEQAWQVIQSRHPEVPDVVMITGPSAQKGGDVWGYHWADRWTLADGTGRAPELFMAGELFSRGGRKIMATMLHEAAHALGAARKIKDTSRSGNRYHNRRFADLAVELGMTPPDKPSKAHGYSDCRLTDDAAAYAETIATLDAAAIAYLIDLHSGYETAGVEDGTTPGEAETGTERPTKPRRGGQRQGVECLCTPPRRLQLTPKALETGPVICGLCAEAFEARDPQEDDEAA